jgi:hypothetical protein
VGFLQNNGMAKAKDPNKDAPKPDRDAIDARLEAEKDIEKDPEFSDSDPTDDLDESELAQKDNSDEDALDALEKERPKPHPGHGHPHSGKGKAK